MQFQMIARLGASMVLCTLMWHFVAQEKVYRAMVLCGDVTQLAYLHGTCVGAIGCRLEFRADRSGLARLHILTLAVVSQLRRQGIGARH